MSSTILGSGLLDNFLNRLAREMPRFDGNTIINATPLIDLTEFIAECAREELKMSIDPRQIRIFGKFESRLPGGSVKSRAAFYIIKDAIERGILKEGSIVFEATSGNFGISLAKLSEIGIKVVVLVSRKLQEGVV
ncbi:MAG TPA: pyridoxal-phosphate dependent enzyme, partial [Geobacterales bacterium]|nr:pyridoxal-phosphate dependent enzyme [Geobacterales bacterium]